MFYNTIVQIDEEIKDFSDTFDPEKGQGKVWNCERVKDDLIRDHLLMIYLYP